VVKELVKNDFTLSLESLLKNAKRLVVNFTGSKTGKSNILMDFLPIPLLEYWSKVIGANAI